MKLATLATSTDAVSVGLEPQRIYTLVNDDSTHDIYLAIGQGNSADGADGDNKYVLSPGACVDIGPGERILSYASSANTPRLLISSVVAEASVLSACGVS